MITYNNYFIISEKEAHDLGCTLTGSSFDFCVAMAKKHGTSCIECMKWKNSEEGKKRLKEYEENNILREKEKKIKQLKKEAYLGF